MKNIPSKDNTVYIVSGFMRTGTSMMMRALEAGGMDIVKKNSREKMRKAYADKYYDPNEGGLYELESEDYKAIGFPKKYQGKLIKCLMGGLDSLCVMPKIKIIYMRRDTEEIVQSYEAFFGTKLMIDKEHFQEKTDLCIERMRNRKDTEILQVWYREVINNPYKAFIPIADFLEIPFNIEKAVQVVNPKLYRFRKERLTIGI